MPVQLARQRVGHMGRDSGRNAVGFMATTFTVVGGALICVFLIASFSEEPSWHASISAGVVSGVLLLLWLLRDRSGAPTSINLKVWLSSRKEERVPFDYQPRRRKRREPRETIAIVGDDALSNKEQRSAMPEESPGNEPPNAESVREIRKSSLSTWVPAGKKGGRA